MNYWVGIIGAGVLLDGLASLWAYTGNSDRAEGQTFWRDHSLRLLRMVYGAVLIWIGAVI